MISTEERNKLAINAKADAINKRHHGKIYIKTDPAEYAGSVVTIPSVAGAASFSFNRELLDDTPGRPVRVAERGVVGGAVNGYADLDAKLGGKAGKQNKQAESKLVKKINKGLEKAIEDDSEQALDDFFASLLK
jgi:carbon monoxide dehydrogenase subunit G